MTRCIIALKNNFIVTKPIFYQWNEKIIQDFNIHMYMDCCHLSWSFKWHATSYNEQLWKLTCFLQAVIFICFIWTAIFFKFSIYTFNPNNLLTMSLILYAFFPKCANSMIFARGSTLIRMVIIPILYNFLFISNLKQFVFFSVTKTISTSKILLTPSFKPPWV